MSRFTEFTVACEHCRLTFSRVRRTSKGQPRFCSKHCVWAATKGPEFNARIARESTASRATKLRGTGRLGPRGYIKEGGRHQHRVVAERMLGRPLTKGEVVHHLDENRRNNAPENLAVLSQVEHMRLHGIGMPGVTPWWKPWEARGKKK